MFSAGSRRLLANFSRAPVVFSSSSQFSACPRHVLGFGHVLGSAFEEWRPERRPEGGRKLVEVSKHGQQRKLNLRRVFGGPAVESLLILPPVALHVGSILGAMFDSYPSYLLASFLDGLFEGFGFVLEAIFILLHFGWSFWLLCWTLRKIRDPTEMLQIAIRSRVGRPEKQ